MANDVLAQWRAFRLYQMPGYDIREEFEEVEDDQKQKIRKLKEISFTNWQISTNGLGVMLGLMPIAGFIMFAAAMAMAFWMIHQKPVTAFSVVFSIVFSMGICVVLPCVLMFKSTKYCSRLTIQPGFVIWDREIARGGGAPPPTGKFSDKANRIPVDEIRSIDVRHTDYLHTQDTKIDLHRVTIWHGPVPIYTIAADDMEKAMTLKEGVVAAIGLLNQKAASPGARKELIGWE
jgi:hypothetical protein